MDLSNLIKIITTKAVKHKDPYVWKQALQDILWIIAREEENARIRYKYYQQNKRFKDDENNYH